MMSLRAAIYQYECRDESPAERLSRLDRMLGAHEGELDLVICPELFLSGYNVGDKIRELAEPQGGPFARAAAALASKRRTSLIYGYPEQAGEAVYNAAACIDRDGRTRHHCLRRRCNHAPIDADAAPQDRVPRPSAARGKAARHQGEIKP